jgi:RNA polymerase sigma-70 factor (ECF subfamily)
MLTRNRSAADDLLQEAAYRALRSKTQFALGTNFTAWIYRIVHNEYISSQRRAKRTPVSIDAVPEEFFSRPGNQEDKLLSREVLHLMDKLKPSQRETLLLICASGLSYEEASAALGCSVGTVKSRLWRARRHMQMLIMGEEGTELAPDTGESAGDGPAYPMAGGSAPPTP